MHTLERRVDTPAAQAGALVEVRGIARTFGAVRALRGVNLDIHAGEVHGLVGANGAGKSTLIRVLAGLVAPDSGTIRVDGELVETPTPSAATELGFAFLHQELNLVGAFSALNNMSLGLLRHGRLGFADRATTYAKARSVAADLKFEFPLDRPVQELTVAQQWKVALGRSLMRSARLIAFDEPTASISAAEAEQLFEIVADLKARDIAVLYVSHRLEEVRNLSDRVTAFRDGGVVAQLERSQVDRPALIRAITGGEADAVSIAASDRESTGPVVLETRNLYRHPMVKGVSLTLRAGEIVGVAGLIGAGRTELARLIFGADPIDSGEILLDGKPVHFRTPADASRRGIGLVPEERRAEGLFLDRDTVFNVNVATAGMLRTARFGPLRPRRSVAHAKEIVERLDVRPATTDRPVRLLSGGNQQKLVLGRWLLGRRRLLILDEPTRGVDIGARAQIHRILRELADDGMALLVISSDFEELLASDRVLVMAGGRVVRELRGTQITEAAMLQAAYGDDANPVPSPETGYSSDGQGEFKWSAQRRPHCSGRRLTT